MRKMSATIPPQKEHIRKMLTDFIAFINICCKRQTEQCNVLMIPGVSVGDRGAVADAYNIRVTSLENVV